MNVNKYTRAGDSGKVICCPFCDNKHRVYHFSWSALWCQTCDTKVDKPDWILHEESKHNMSYYDSLLTAGTS